MAVVLPGGGARGAYEIGAMAVLLPALQARGERVEIWSGTSVGAINATMLASLAHLSAEAQSEGALERWDGMRKQDVIARIAGRGGARALLRAAGHLLGLPGAGIASLLDPSPLQASLDRWIDWKQLNRNVESERVRGEHVRASAAIPTGSPAVRLRIAPSPTRWWLRASEARSAAWRTRCSSGASAAGAAGGTPTTC